MSHLLLLLVLAAACSGESPDREPEQRSSPVPAAPPAPHPPPASPPPRAERDAAVPPAPPPAPAGAAALVLHGQDFHLLEDPLPGRGLRLLFGGPPYRLCTVPDLAVADRVHCQEVRLASPTAEADLASMDDDAPVLLRASGATVTRPLVDPTTGREAAPSAVFDAFVSATGPLAGIGGTAAGDLELLRFRAGRPPDRMHLPDDRGAAAPFLLGDTALFGREGHLVSAKVQSGESAFGPLEDHGTVPPWSLHQACRARDGTVMALLHGDLTTLVPNVGSVDVEGPATAVFLHGDRLETTAVTLPARPRAVSCDSSGLSVVTVDTDRRRATGRRQHQVRRIHCEPAGCTESTVRLGGFTAWNPPAVEIDGRTVLAHIQGNEVRTRVARFVGLAQATDRPVALPPEDAVPPTRIDLLARGGAAALVVDFPDRTFLFRITADGAVTPLAPDAPLPPLPPGVPRFGSGAGNGGGGGG